MRITYPTYYEESVDTNYPFEATASRTNGVVTIENDTFVDGRLFPPHGERGLFISKIVVAAEVKIYLSDSRGEIGYGVFDRDDPPDTVTFTTGRVHLGLLQSGSEGGLAKLSGWSDGEYVFLAAQTKFAASVVVPQPQVGVRSITLESGEVFDSDVTIVGEKGVQFTAPRYETSSSSSSQMRHSAEAIRVDVVGDPLFLRRACEGANFRRDAVITGINFDGTLVEPDSNGGFLLTIAHSSGNRPALRLVPVTNGLGIGFVSG